MSVAARPQLSHLRALESEAIHVMREVAAEFERPVLLFSGGKDSIVLLRLAEKAFRPAPFPFPLMHVDTGHNFPEVIEFRDRRVAELGERLIVASVQESIDKGRVVEETGPRASRNRLQTVTLLDAIAEHGFDAAFGGARRDEERARAKERIFSFRDDFGQWDPKNQRPELWNLYNGRIHKGEHVRVFPLSNWTELDVWEYIDQEQLEVPSIYFAHEREVFERDGMLYAWREGTELIDGEEVFTETVRYRTVGDMSCTGGVRSQGGHARGGRAGDRRHDGSPSAARPARTTASRRPPWRTARRPGTSSARHDVLDWRAARAGRRAGPGRRWAVTLDLLRFTTAGSVDDGKSTLIGRLLYDSKQVFEDQLAQVAQASERRGGEGTLDLALLTDGLRAEREQGITIDVAYRYFATAKRRFIIADCPGHQQYTRNMVTGASTADVSVVLIDARRGVLEQSKRHAFISALLGIPQMVVAINKMDLVDYSQSATRSSWRSSRASPRSWRRRQARSPTSRCRR